MVQAPVEGEESTDWAKIGRVLASTELDEEKPYGIPRLSALAKTYGSTISWRKYIVVVLNHWREYYHRKGARAVWPAKEVFAALKAV